MPTNNMDVRIESIIALKSNDEINNECIKIVIITIAVETMHAPIK